MVKDKLLLIGLTVFIKQINILKLSLKLNLPNKSGKLFYKVLAESLKMVSYPNKHLSTIMLKSISVFLKKDNQ